MLTNPYLFINQLTRSQKTCNFEYLFYLKLVKYISIFQNNNKTFVELKFTKSAIFLNSCSTNQNVKGFPVQLCLSAERKHIFQPRKTRLVWPCFRGLELNLVWSVLPCLSQWTSDRDMQKRGKEISIELWPMRFAWFWCIALPIWVEGEVILMDSSEGNVDLRLYNCF